MGVNEHEGLSNFTLLQKIKQRNNVIILNSYY